MTISLSTPLEEFTFAGKTQKVAFVETSHVKEDVNCDVYTFDNDNTKDLGIIRIGKGAKTPLQKVLKGDRTIEGYMSGKGRLLIGLEDGTEKIYNVDEKTGKAFAVTVKIGETMQWQAESNLVVYEICFPPYADGRYENPPE